MIFLGIDTATRVGSVGLVRAALEDGEVLHPEPGRVAEGCARVAEVTRDTGLGHGSEILSLIDECLAAAGADVADVGCIAVSIGPGSFTGLRVALATAKGLSLGGGAPLVGVPTLSALAATVLPGWGAATSSAPALGTVIAPCLDARKGEVYGATFVVCEPALREPLPGLERTSDDAAFAPEAFRRRLEECAAAGARVILLGDGCARYENEIGAALGECAHVVPFADRPPSGVSVARMGAGIFAASGPDDRANLVPRYARASEAEVMRERRGAGALPR